MENEEVRNLIEEYIIQDRLDTAFSILKNWTHDSEMRTAFLNLWGMFNKNEKHYRIEREISYDEYILHSNRIRNSIIRLVDEIFSSKVDRYKKATYFMKLGSAKMEENDFEKAIEYFEKVLEIVPNHVQAILDRGVANLNTTRLDSALLDFERVLQLEPDNPFALNNRGVTYFQMGDKSKACKDWKKVRDLDFPISNFSLINHCQ
jgi:tetratricopeptide (TPR) repeat protein